MLSTIGSSVESNRRIEAIQKISCSEQLIFFTPELAGGNWRLQFKFAYRDQKELGNRGLFGKYELEAPVRKKKGTGPTSSVAKQALSGSTCQGDNSVWWLSHQATKLR